jgi:hypothetical protein
VIGTMWTGGNVAHYAPERPRVLIDGNPNRATWIDLSDLTSKGAAVVWTEGDPRVLPAIFRAVAENVDMQAPFTLPYRRGEGAVDVGWAVLRPRLTPFSTGVYSPSFGFTDSGRSVASTHANSAPRFWCLLQIAAD